MLLLIKARRSMRRHVRSAEPNTSRRLVSRLLTCRKYGGYFVGLLYIIFL